MIERDAVNAPSLDREQGVLDRLEQSALASLHAQVVLPQKNTISPHPCKHTPNRRLLLAPTCRCRMRVGCLGKEATCTSTEDPSIRARGVTPVGALDAARRDMDGRRVASERTRPCATPRRAAATAKRRRGCILWIDKKLETF